MNLLFFPCFYCLIEYKKIINSLHLRVKFSFVGFKVVFYRRKKENQLLGYDATYTGGLDQYLNSSFQTARGRNEAFREHQGKRLTFSVVNGNFINILSVIFFFFFSRFLSLQDHGCCYGRSHNYEGKSSSVCAYSDTNILKLLLIAFLGLIWNSVTRKRLRRAIPYQRSKGLPLYYKLYVA